MVTLLITLSFPFLFCLIGSVFDYKTRSEGNFRYDLPSTFGFIIGCILTCYVNWYLEQFSLLLSYLLTLLFVSRFTSRGKPEIKAFVSLVVVYIHWKAFYYLFDPQCIPIPFQ